MSEDLEKIRQELEDLGYVVSTHQHQQGQVVDFDYQVKTGPHAGETYKMGISMNSPGYPEYPPHWIHVSPPVSDEHGGEEYFTDDGCQWVAMSRPPADIWDQLPEKNMKHYIEMHLGRFWMHVK